MGQPTTWACGLRLSAQSRNTTVTEARIAQDGAIPARHATGMCSDQLDRIDELPLSLTGYALLPARGAVIFLTPCVKGHVPARVSDL